MEIEPPKLALEMLKNRTEIKEDQITRDSTKIAVGIFEDDRRDLVARYKSLSGTYELYVYLSPKLEPIWPQPDPRKMQQTLAERGMVIERVYFFREEMPKTLDLYFTDGLDWDCLGVADKFGKDKTYILSGDPLLNSKAREEGFRLVDCPLEEIIGRHSK